MIVLTKEFSCLAAASIASLLGAREDMRSRRIPNLLTGGSILCGLVLHLFLGGPGGMGMAALAGLTAGSLLLVMYLAGGMGAGDVKLMAAVGCLAGFAPLRAILTGTFLSGALFGIALALYHRRLRQTVGKALLLIGHDRQRIATPVVTTGQDAVPARELSLPYAVPIAAGCLIAMGALLWKG